MAVRIARVLAVLGVAFVFAMPATSAGAEPADQPVFPSGKLTLTPKGEKFTTSIPVINSTSDGFLIEAPEDANACLVTVSDGAELAKTSTSTVELTIADQGACDAPVDGKQRTIVLTATAVDADGAPLDGEAAPVEATFETAVAKLAGTGDPTGLEWPEEPVFLQRNDDDLTGAIEVANPTAAVISVPPIRVNGKCKQTVDKTAEPVTIDAHNPGKVPVTADLECKEFDSGEVVVVATATAGNKTDSKTIKLEAEVDWGLFTRWLIGIFVGAVIISAVAMGLGIAHHNGDLMRAEAEAERIARITDSAVPEEATAPKTRLKSPLIVKADAPKGWLTTIATVGPLLTGLVGTAGLTESFTGSDSVPQSALIVGVSALALVLVGIGTLVANAPLVRAKVDKEMQDCPAVLQFSLAAAITATSAGIGLWGVWTALSRLDLPIDEGWRWGIGLFFAATLVVYLAWSVYHYVDTYAAPVVPAPPVPPTPTAELVASTSEALAPYYLRTAPGSARPSHDDVDAWLAAARAAAVRAVAKIEADKVSAASQAEAAKEDVAEAEVAAQGTEEGSEQRATLDRKMAAHAVAERNLAEVMSSERMLVQLSPTPAPTSGRPGSPNI